MELEKIIQSIFVLVIQNTSNQYLSEWVIIVLRRFLYNHGNIATQEARSRDYALLLSNAFMGSS